MKKIEKKIVILITLVIVLFTVSAVNASDVTSNNTISDSVIHESYKDTTVTPDSQNNNLEGDSYTTNSLKDDSIKEDSEKTKFNSTSNTKNIQKTTKSTNNKNVLSYANNNEANTSDAISSSNNNDVLSTSFAELQTIFNNAYEGGTLILDSDYSLADGGHTLKLEKSLTIDGDGHTLDGNSDDCILKINKDGINVILKNIVFNNGKSDEGGAILNTHSSSTLTLQDCKFNDNYARGLGGAIYLKGSVDIKGCKFNDNYGDNYGGAIYADKEVKVRDTSFDNNQAVLGGGAIYCGGKTTIINSQFGNNKADGVTAKKCNGGAIYSVGECNIVLGYFGNNYAENDGGAVYAEDNLIINDSHFQKNDAKYGSGGIFANKKITIENSKINKNSGYYVIRAKGECYIDSCSFDHNTAGTIVSDDDLIITGQTKFTNNHNDAPGGGAIYALKNVYINWDSNTDGYCEFYSNSGSQGLLGGAIYCEGNIYGKSLKFNKNYVPSSPQTRGGAIYCKGETRINSSVFDDNWVVIPATWIENVPVEGGAIWSKGKCYIDSCTFTNNQGGCRGGAICAYDDLTITGQSTFTKNSVMVFNLAVGLCSDPDGGAIYCKGNANINNAIFSNNEAVVDGGAIFCEGECTVSNSKFINNSADNGDAAVPYVEYSYGGAIRSKGTLTVKNCRFDDNYAYTDGGAIYADTTVKVTGSNFNRNMVPIDGGAIYSKGETTLSDSTFYQNDASHVNYAVAENSYGGAVCSKGTIIVNKCSFDCNGADNYGSAIYAYSDANIKDSNFTNHISASSGGVIYCEGNADIDNSVFYYNEATVDGGAIFCEGQTSISNSVFKNNSALDGFLKRSFGGAIISEKSITVESSHFEDNFAYNNGGAIYSNADITIDGCTFTNNKVNVDGGAVYSDKSVSISNSNFKGNKATGSTVAKSYGGAVRSNGVTPIINSTFDNNFAYNLGGAIYSDTTIVLDGCTFTNNEVNVDGGAVYGDKSVSISNSIFHNNAATGSTNARSYGGAVRSNELIEVKYCDFSNNYAYNRGGAIYTDTEIKITGSNFTSNSAKDYGGAVYTSTLNKEVSNSIFNKNKCTSGDGGAIYINNKCSPKFYSSIFEDNTANNKGGGIYIDSKDAPLDLGECTFLSNTAGNGGAIYTGTMTESTSNCIFLKNKATSEDGGAIYINNNCDPKFISCRFEYNTANTRGGALYLDSSHAMLTLLSCTFVDNTAGKSGQNVYCSGDYTKISECWFGKNDHSKNDQFKIWHSIRADEDYTNYLITPIQMTVNSDNLYVGNTYELKVNFIRPSSGNGYIIRHSTGEFYADNPKDASFSNVHAGDGDMSAYITIYKENPTIHFKLDNQVLTLNLKTKNKNPSNVTIISCEDVKYPNPLQVEYKIINMTANAAYTIKNEETTAPVANGKITKAQSTLTVNNLNPGKYYIEIYNAGNTTTNSSSAIAHFKVYAVVSASITADNVTYGNTTTITLKTDIDGTYNVDIGGSVIEMEVINGVCVKQIKLDAGNYQTYTSRKDYIINCKEALFKVDKAINNVVVEVDNVTYGELSNIKVKADFDGIYDVKINGTTYKVPVQKGVGNKSIQFKAGQYYANVSFYNNDIIYNKNYITISKNTTFKVSKADIDLVVIVFDEVYGDEIESIVYSSVDGEYNLTIAGDLTIVTVKDNFAYFEHGILNAGTYEANVSFNGNNNYNAAFNRTTFNVYPTGTSFELEINPSEISYGGTVIVTHKLSDGAIGTIKYYLKNGTFLGELDVTGNLTLSEKWDVGSYVIIGNYSGDHNHSPASDTTIFRVKPAQNNAILTVSNVTYGEKSLIELTAYVDGIYQVNVNGTVYNITVNNGIGNKSLALNSGVYYANVSFKNRNYNTIAHNTNFEVYKADTNLIVVVAYSTYHGDTPCIVYPENILGIVYSDVDGEYNLTIGDYSTIINVNEGFCEFNAGIFDAGNYTIFVTYPGDLNHKANSTSTNLTVDKFSPKLSLSVQDIIYGDTALLVITCDVTGSVNVTVNGKTETLNLNQWTNSITVSPVNFIKTKTRAFLTLDNLDAGNYHVIIVYNGNNNVESTSIFGEFKVILAQNNASVSVSNVTYGENTLIEVTADVDGIYQVNVNGTVYNITVMNGFGNKTLSLNASSYYANITFNNKNYNTTSHNTTFEVYKAATNIMVVALNKTYPQEIEGFVYSDVDGEYNLTIGDDSNIVYSIIVLVKYGSAKFNAGVLDAGNYTVLVTYPGDMNHKANSTSRKVTVAKFTPNISFKVSNIDYGGVAVISINCDLEGSVNVTVNGITETINLNGQKKDILLASPHSILKSEHSATLSLYNLDSGVYPVTVTYNGDKNIESSSVTGEFNVNALNTTMDIDAHDINVGETEKITVKLTNNVTGTVTITVDGKDYTAPIKDGTAVINIPNLRSGYKTAKVYYSGSRNYNPNTGTISFTVNKIKPNMTAESNSPIDSGKKLKIVVKLPSDATGTVTIVISGKKYTVSVKNGKAIFNIPGLAKGKYKLKAKYSGDDKYYTNQTELAIAVNDNGNKHENKTNKVTKTNKNNHKNNTGKVTSVKNRVPMQKTGVPICWAVVALLMIVTGFTLPKKRPKK